MLSHYIVQFKTYYRLESALSNILKMNIEGRLSQWKEQAIAIGLLITETSRKVNDNEADDKDYGNIKSKAAQLGVSYHYSLRTATLKPRTAWAREEDALQ